MAVHESNKSLKTILKKQHYIKLFIYICAVFRKNNLIYNVILNLKIYV